MTRIPTSCAPPPVLFAESKAAARDMITSVRSVNAPHPHLHPHPHSAPAVSGPPSPSSPPSLGSVGHVCAMSKTSPTSEPKLLPLKPPLNPPLQNLPSSDTHANSNSSNSSSSSSSSSSLSHSIISIQNLVSSSSSSPPSSFAPTSLDAGPEKSSATAVPHTSPSSSPTMAPVRIYPLGPLSSHNPARSSEVSPSAEDNISHPPSSFSAAALAAPMFPTTTTSSLMALAGTTASSPGPPVQAFPSSTASSSSFKSIASLSSSSSSSSFPVAISNPLPVFSQSFNLSTASSLQSGCIVPSPIIPALENSSSSVAPSTASSLSPPTTDSNNMYDPSSPASHNATE